MLWERVRSRYGMSVLSGRYGLETRRHGAMLQRPVEKPIQNLLCKKSSEFWTARFDAVQIQPRRLSGGLLMNCSAAVACLWQWSTQLTFIAISMTRLLASVLLPLVSNRRLSPPFLSAVFSGFSLRSHQLTSRRSCSRCLTNTVCHTHCQLGCWRKMPTYSRPFCVDFSTGAWRRAVDFQVRLIYAVTQKSRSRCGRLTSNLTGRSPICQSFPNYLNGSLRNSLWITSEKTMCCTILIQSAYKCPR